MIMIRRGSSLPGIKINCGLLSEKIKNTAQATPCGSTSKYYTDKLKICNKFYPLVLCGCDML
jgi:hypothetical protein